MECINLSNAQLKHMSEQKKQELLLSCIPFLSRCESKFGNEGKAFFINQDLIVKKYFTKADTHAVLGHIFDMYCKECVEFSKKGYQLPQIHAWTIISRPDHTGFDYYILEERVPGRELFIDKVEKIYSMFTDTFSPAEFKQAIAVPYSNWGSYEIIIRNYIHDFIHTNQIIESMSDDKLEAFLENIFNMMKECEYSIPDVHARNVLLNGTDLNLIDNYMPKDEEEKIVTKSSIDPDFFVLARIVALFKFNENVKNYKNTNDNRMMFVNPIVDSNNILCAEAIKKMIRVAKRNHKFSGNAKAFEGLLARLRKILNEEQVVEVMNTIDFNIVEKQ